MVKDTNLKNLEYSSGKPPDFLWNSLNTELYEIILLEIIKRYENHGSIVKIKNYFFDIGLFEVRTEDVNAIIRLLNPNNILKVVLFWK